MLVVAGGVMLFLSPHPDVAALCLLGVLSLALWLLAHSLVPERREVQFLSWVLFATIGLRFVWAVIEHYVYPSLQYMLQADSLVVLHMGRELAMDWRGGVSRPTVPSDLSDVHDWLHTYRSAFLFLWFGYSPLLPEVTNIVLSASSALAGYMVVRRWASVRAARIAALVIAFWPSIMVWSTHNLKDPVNLAAVTWSTFGILQLRDRVTLSAFATVISAWVVGFLIRPYLGVLAITGQMVAIGLIAVKSRTALGRYLAIVLTLVLAGVSLTVGNRQIKQMYGESVSLQYAEEKRQTFYEGAVEDRAVGVRHSEYVIDLRASSTAGALLQLPLRIPLFLLSPIPVRLGSLPLMGTYPEMVFLYWLIPPFILGLRHVWRRYREEAIFVLCTVAPIIVVFSIGTSISGEAVRYRDIILPELLLFAAVGWAARVEARQAAAETRRARSSPRTTKNGKALVLGGAEVPVKGSMSSGPDGRRQAGKGRKVRPAPR